MLADLAPWQLCHRAPRDPASAAAGHHRLSGLCLRTCHHVGQRGDLPGQRAIQPRHRLYRRAGGDLGLRRRHRLLLGPDHLHAGGDRPHPAGRGRAAPCTPNDRDTGTIRNRLMSIINRFAAVVLERVRKHYGTVVAVEDVSVTIEAGTLVTLLEPSGCGKTTTLRMVAGLEMPTAGRILIGDKDVTLLPPNERDVSMVFQSYALFPHMPVLENVSYGLADAALTKAQRLDKAHEGLRLVGLEGYDDRLPS